MQRAKRIAPAGRPAEDHPLGPVMALAPLGTQVASARLGERLDDPLARLVLRRVQVAAQQGRRVVVERGEAREDRLEGPHLRLTLLLRQRGMQA